MQKFWFSNLSRINEFNKYEISISINGIPYRDYDQDRDQHRAHIHDQIVRVPIHRMVHN